MTISNKGDVAKITLPTPFPVGDVNVYVIKGERLTLVDAGPKTKEAYELLCKKLKEINLSINDIEQVVLTHHHPDHSGLLDYLPESIEVYGHPVNDRWLYPTESFINEQKDFYQKLFVEFGIPKDYFGFISLMEKELELLGRRRLTGHLLEGMSPIGLSEWKVIETPGHAQSHIGLYREKDKVYVGGDQLIAHVSPNPLIEPPLPGEKERPKSLVQYNESQRKLLKIPMKIVYSGHGKEIYDKNELIESRFKKQRERAYLVKGWLEKESLTVFEVCQRLFPKVYKKQLPLTISETVGQLDFLSVQNEIKMKMVDGALRFSASKISA